MQQDIRRCRKVLKGCRVVHTGIMAVSRLSIAYLILLTLDRFLLADPDCPGSLQVLSKSTSPDHISDRDWIPADPIQGCMVVNIGEMWEIWSGGLYPATLHRVVHRSPTYRISIPFFFEPNFDARVRVLDGARRKAAEEERASCTYQDTIYGEFLLKKVGANFGY